MEYYRHIDDSIEKKERFVFNSKIVNYFDDCVNVLHYLTTIKGMNVILINFDTNTRDLVEALKYNKESDISKIQVIDAVSIISGKGTPPVPKVITVYRPNAFSDIQIYTYVFLQRLAFDNTIVVHMSLHMLELYENVNEVGIFMRVFRDYMKRYNIPEIVLTHDSVNSTIQKIIENNAEKMWLHHYYDGPKSEVVEPKDDTSE